nr:hypothetical protein [Tanacetum cinerariifolium]
MATAEHDLNDLDDLDLDDLDLNNRIKKLKVDFGMMLKAKKEKEDRPKRSRAPTRQVASTSTSSAQAALTLALRKYRKIAMIEFELCLRTPNDPNAPTSAPKRGSPRNPD